MKSTALWGLFSALGWSLLATGPGWADAGPLLVRNLGPVPQLYGLPRARGANLSAPGTRMHVNLEITNDFRDRARGDDAAVFDGESYLTTWSMSRAVGRQRRFEVGLEIPYIHHTGGHLDGFIDGFHDLFGFPDSGRSAVARGLLNYQVRVDGVTYADIQEGQGHVADLRAWLGYQAYRDQDTALALRGMIKLPTGSVASLSGSGGTDVAVWAEYANSRLLRALRLELSLMAGAVLLGDGDLAPGDQRDVAGIFHFGLQLPLGNRLRLHGQLDAHSELLDTAVPHIGGWALQGTLGGRIKLSQRFWLDLGVVENLTTKSAPDVTFQIMLGARIH